MPALARLLLARSDRMTPRPTERPVRRLVGVSRRPSRRPSPGVDANWTALALGVGAAARTLTRPAA